MRRGQLCHKIAVRKDHEGVSALRNNNRNRENHELAQDTTLCLVRHRLPKILLKQGPHNRPIAQTSPADDVQGEPQATLRLADARTDDDSHAFTVLNHRLMDRRLLPSLSCTYP